MTDGGGAFERPHFRFPTSDFLFFVARPDQKICLPAQARANHFAPIRSIHL
jgi:hypothetical protein